MGRSKSRLIADWFAKLRVNAQTQEVEHEDVTSVKEEVDTTVTTEIATLENDKADVTYVDSEMAALDSEKADLSYVNTKLGTKADTSYVNAQLNTKANASTTYSKTEVDNAINNIDLSVKADTTYVDNAINNIEGVPTGVILMWSGSVSSIPAGWYLCNGSNGTPNLTDRFVYGASSNGEVNTTGGSANAVVVSHSHSGSAASAGSHSHSGSTNTTGNHRHRMRTHRDYGGAGYVSDSGGSDNKSAYTDYTGNHSHTVSINSGGSHSHSVTVNDSGESGTNKNLPPYMKLAYIMKG